MAMQPMGMTPGRGKASLDIYGVLVILSTSFVLLAMIYVFVKSAALFGSPLPIPGDS